MVDKLTKSYPTIDGELNVLRELSFTLNRGESLAVTGPSGTGKSTLLHILGSLDRPTSGSVSLVGIDLAELNDTQSAKFRREHVGFIFQDHQLMPQLTVFENVLIPALGESNNASAHERRAVELIEAVGLSPRSNHLPSELSGGERARVAVARSLLLRPTMVLADEPTGNLDPENAQKIGALLLDLQRLENNLLIVVTHSLDLAATMQRQLRLG